MPTTEQEHPYMNKEVATTTSDDPYSYIHWKVPTIWLYHNISQVHTQRNISHSYLPYK